MKSISYKSIKNNMKISIYNYYKLLQNPNFIFKNVKFISEPHIRNHNFLIKIWSFVKKIKYVFNYYSNETSSWVGDLISKNKM